MTTALIPSTSAVLLRGQRAWLRIKATAAEQRQLWRDVGEALLVLRREHASNQAFGAACAAHGFDMHRQDRSDAMWLADNWLALSDGTTTLTHPTRIRQEHRAATAPTLPPEDTAIDTLLVNAAKVAGKERGILAKAAHAQEDTPEGHTAKRMLERQAAALDMSPEDLVAAAKTNAPQVAPGDQQRLDNVLMGLDKLTATYTAVLLHNKDLGLTPELITLRVYQALKAAQ